MGVDCAAMDAANIGRKANKRQGNSG
jgi:hypothetical protein